MLPFLQLTPRLNHQPPIPAAGDMSVQPEYAGFWLQTTKYFLVLTNRQGAGFFCCPDHLRHPENAASFSLWDVPFLDQDGILNHAEYMMDQLVPVTLSREMADMIWAGPDHYYYDPQSTQRPAQDLARTSLINRLLKRSLSQLRCLNELQPYLTCCSLACAALVEVA